MKLNLQRVIFEFQEMVFSYAFGKNGGRIDGRCRAVRRHHPAFRRVGKARKGKVEAREGRPFEKEQKGTEMPGMKSLADEQLLPVPQALLRISQGNQVLQAGSIRELLPLPLEPRQKHGLKATIDILFNGVCGTPKSDISAKLF